MLRFFIFLVVLYKAMGIVPSRDEYVRVFTEMRDNEDSPFAKYLEKRTELGIDSTVSVKVVGGGPAGLLAALMSIEMGVKDVTVFEMREAYTRRNMVLLPGWPKILATENFKAEFNRLRPFVKRKTGQLKITAGSSEEYTDPLTRIISLRHLERYLSSLFEMLGGKIVRAFAIGRCDHPDLGSFVITHEGRYDTTVDEMEHATRHICDTAVDITQQHEYEGKMYTFHTANIIFEATGGAFGYNKRFNREYVTGPESKCMKYDPQIGKSKPPDDKEVTLEPIRSVAFNVQQSPTHSGRGAQDQEAADRMGVCAWNSLDVPDSALEASPTYALMKIPDRLSEGTVDEPEGCCYMVVDLVHPSVMDLESKGGVEGMYADDKCEENAPVFGTDGDVDCQINWVDALMTKIGHPERTLCHHEGNVEKLDISYWQNKLHVATEESTVGKHCTGGSDPHCTYFVVVGDAARSSLYHTGEGVAGAMDLLNIVHPLVEAVVNSRSRGVVEEHESMYEDDESEENAPAGVGKSVPDAIEKLLLDARDQIQTWKGQTMASFLQVFVDSPKVSVVEWDGLFGSGQLQCKNKLESLKKKKDALKHMIVTNAAGPVTSGGAAAELDRRDALRFLRKRDGDEGGGSQSRSRGVLEGSSTRHRHNHNQHGHSKEKRTRIFPEKEHIWGDLWGI